MAGGARLQGAMARPTTVKILPRIVGVAGMVRRRTRIEVEHRREDKGNQSQNPPAGYHRGGGGETKGENQHEMERWHNRQSREGCLAENAYQKRKQNNVHHKGKKTKHTVLCHCVSSQITLAAPMLGAEEGVSRTTKKNEHEKTTVPCLCLAARLPRPCPSTEWGGRRDGRRKTNKREKRDHPGPSTGRGGR